MENPLTQNTTVSWFTDRGHFEFQFTLQEGVSGLGELSFSLYALRQQGLYRHVLVENVSLEMASEVIFDEGIDTFQIAGVLETDCFVKENAYQYVVAGRFAEEAEGHISEFQGSLYVEYSNLPPSHISPQPIEPISPIEPEPNPPFVPPDDEIANSLDNRGIPQILQARSVNLFPYTYMRNWPEPDKYSEDVFVIRFPFKNSTVYQSFSALANSNNRLGLEDAVTQFINNSTADSGYISDARELPEPFDAMLGLWPELHRELSEDVDIWFAGHLSIEADELQKLLKDPQYQATLERVWLSYLANVVKSGYKIDNTKLFTILLRFNHLLNYIITHKDKGVDKQTLTWLTLAFISLPAPVFPLPAYSASPPLDNPDDWFEVYAIGELQLVKQRLKRYETGEIAELVNIMAGEKRESNIRDKESYTATTFNEEVSVTDHLETATDSQEDLVKEVSETIAGFKDTYDYKDLTSKYGPPTNITTNGTWYLEKNAGDPGNEKISKFAKQVFEASTNLIQSQVKKARATQSITEREAITQSQFDNSQNSQPVVGIYKWLNKIYQAEVINYGQRLILSFSINAPAGSLIKTTEKHRGADLQLPKPLTHFGIHNYTNLALQDLPELVSYYGVFDLPPAPAAQKQVSGTVYTEGNQTFDIPEGYAAQTAYITYAIDSNTSIKVVVGRKAYVFDHPASNSKELALDNETHTLPVSITSNSKPTSPPSGLNNFSLTVEVDCLLQKEVFQQWQYKVYAKLSAAYEAKLAHYYELSTSLGEREGLTNPETLRLSVFRQLQRRCIQALQARAAKFQAQQRPASPPTQYRVNKLRYRQFFETSIEWNEIVYFLDEHSPSDSQLTTPIRVPPSTSTHPEFFADFLQAEVARVFVPIRPSYSHSFLFFLSCANVWMAQDELAPVIESQIGQKIELTKLNPTETHSEKLIDDWEVTIPTSLHLLSGTMNHTEIVENE